MAFVPACHIGSVSSPILNELDCASSIQTGTVFVDAKASMDDDGFNEERQRFISELCFPDAERWHNAEMVERLELAQALAEDIIEWADVVAAWLHHFGLERVNSAVECVCRAEASVFFGKHLDDFDLYDFSPSESFELFFFTSEIAHCWVRIAGADKRYLDKAVRAMEIAERCSKCSHDACYCARLWITLPFPGGMTRALAAMDHAMSLFIEASHAAPEYEEAEERVRIQLLAEEKNAICIELIRSFGSELGEVRLKQFLADCAKSPGG